MKRIGRLLLLCALSLTLSAGYPLQEAPFCMPVFDRYPPAAQCPPEALACSVKIEAEFTTDDGGRWVEQGSGILLETDKVHGTGLVMTNDHLVCGDRGETADSIWIYLYGMDLPQYAIKGQYIGGYSSFDYALISIKNSTILKRSHAVSALVRTASPQVGEMVYAIGNSIGRGIAVSTGVVSRIDEPYGAPAGWLTRYMLRTDAPLNPGNSGGGLFDSQGRLIGMICSRVVETEGELLLGIGYAIPCYLTDALLDAASQGDRKLYIPPFECTVTEVSVQVRGDGIRLCERVSITESQISSLQVGDIVMKIKTSQGESEVASLPHLLAALLAQKQGEEIQILIERHGQQKWVSLLVTLTNAP